MSQTDCLSPSSSRQAFAEHLRQEYIRLTEASCPAPEIVFITATFNWKATGCPSIEELRPSYLIRKFKNLYLHVLKALLGGRFNRVGKKHLQPMAYVFVDHPSTKKGRGGKRKTTQDHPHIHSVWLIPPALIHKMRAIMREMGSEDGRAKIIRALGSPFQDVDAKLVPVADISAVVNYASKIFDAVSPAHCDRYWDIFPISASEHRTSRLPPTPRERSVDDATPSSNAQANAKSTHQEPPVDSEDDRKSFTPKWPWYLGKVHSVALGIFHLLVRPFRKLLIRAPPPTRSIFVPIITRVYVLAKVFRQGSSL